MKHIGILNGPNLNLIGRREPGVYGTEPFDKHLDRLKLKFKKKANLSFYQSNGEGELIDKLHEWGFQFDGIIINAGGYSHTSVALLDAVKSIDTPVVEVHISNIYAREAFRHKSLISPLAYGVIVGLGLKGYDLAISAFLDAD